MNVPAIEHINDEPIRKLLRTVSLNRAAELDALLDELSPIFELDRQTERNLFQAILGTPNIIRIGLKCTVRLQAHAYGAGVILVALGTKGFPELSDEKRASLLEPANRIFTWSVGLDLQRWLKRQGIILRPEEILIGASENLPTDLLPSLSKTQRLFGEGLFRFACAYILLHELGHLKFGHSRSTYENEKVADRFAAEWMSDAAYGSSGDVESDRLVALYGITVALLWLTIFNVYFGPKDGNTHPEGYDRLYQVLDQVIDWSNEEEHQMVWYFVSQMLFLHMWSAGFDFGEQDEIHMQGHPRAEVNYLIDRISRNDRKR